jgi:Restriction endonuclease EcoRII, N-terminal
MLMTAEREIRKTLSANDTGETGAHQAGMCVPKNSVVLAFFPRLDGTKKNPRATVKLIDRNGDSWSFQFIYYNNRLFGGTRNEYRLTGIGGFLRANGIKKGDDLVFWRSKESGAHIDYARARAAPVIGADRVLRLRGGWMVIPI